MPDLAIDRSPAPSDPAVRPSSPISPLAGPSSRECRALRIRIVVYSAADAIYAKVAKAVALERERMANLSISIDKCDLTSDVAFADHVAELAQSEQALLIVSDRFTPQAAAGGADTCGLAQLVRERCGNANAITALLALVDPPLRRIGLVDNVVERDTDGPTLAQAIARALVAIRYKYPPAARKPDTGESLEVQTVKDIAQFRACLALRYSVYKQLGYFYEDPESESAGLELQYFDPSALHFVALARDGASQTVAGTARLVVAGTQWSRDGVFGDTARLRTNSERLCAEIAADEPTLRKNLETGPGAAALPLFAAFDASDLAPEKRLPISDFSELSRVVVAEEFRGLGVSRLLVRACIAAAFALRRRYILLECIPQHTRLYEKFGFTKVTEKNQRAWGIDQLATVMRLGLSDDPTNVAVQVAKGDLDMMRAARVDTPPPASLCLCRNAGCWERGAYESRGRPSCPLRSSFVQ